MRYNDSLTVYSRSVSAGEESWSRSNIDHVMWEDARIANRTASGLMEADRVVVFISFAEGEISIKPGDFLVRGTITAEISPTYTMTDLRADYPNSAVVREVNRLDMGTNGLNHWEIGAN